VRSIVWNSRIPHTGRMFKAIRQRVRGRHDATRCGISISSVFCRNIPRPTQCPALAQSSGICLMGSLIPSLLLREHHAISFEIISMLSSTSSSMLGLLCIHSFFCQFVCGMSAGKEFWILSKLLRFAAVMVAGTLCFVCAMRLCLAVVLDYSRCCRHTFLVCDFCLRIPPACMGWQTVLAASSADVACCAGNVAALVCW